MNRSTKKELISLATVILASCISALGLHVFVYPADFAPSGIDGISTVLQELTGVNAGIFNLMINVPLLIAAGFVLSRRYVFYTVIYTCLTSCLLLVLATFGAYRYTSSEGGMLLPAIFGGVAQGLTGLTLRVGGSAGGVDVIACMIQKRHSHRNVEGIISVLSYATVAVSYLVYRNLDSVLLSIAEIFVCERVTAAVLRSSRSAVEFRIITDDPRQICDGILRALRKTATVVSGLGAFSGEGKWVVICVVNYRQIPHMLELIGQCDGSFAYYSDVTGIRGAFDWGIEDDG